MLVGYASAICIYGMGLKVRRCAHFGLFVLVRCFQKMKILNNRLYHFDRASAILLHTL